VRRPAVALLALAALALGAMAATATADTVVREHKTSLHAVEAEVMCVSCGVPLAIAESPQADAERREITRLIDEGKTKDQVKAALVAQYGDRVLATPKDEGFGLAADLVPIALVLLALAAGAFFLPRWKARERGGVLPAEGPALSDADARRLEDDLANYKL
jgi:cytochrome c-type biogenesis protein CcmH/NrfF